jgi:hypothetical protein
VANHTYFLITHLYKEGLLELDASVFTAPVLADTTIVMPMKMYSADVGAPLPTDLSDLDPDVWKPIHEDLEFLTGEPESENGETEGDSGETDGEGDAK